MLKENASVVAKEKEAFLLLGIEREKAQVAYSSQEEVVFKQLTCRL